MGSVKQTMRILGSFALALFTVGCAGGPASSNLPEPRFTDLQVDYMATNRCLYEEGLLSRQQLTEKVENDAKEDTSGFMQPIVETLSTGISEGANQRIADNISKTGCRNKVLAWVATSVPDDTAAKLTMELMERWQKKDGE